MNKKDAVQQLQRASVCSPMENPFRLRRGNPKDFDGSKIQYSDEYLRVTGIENPKEQTAIWPFYFCPSFSREVKLNGKTENPCPASAVCRDAGLSVSPCLS